MDIFGKISALKERGELAVLITVVEKEGEGPVAVGNRMLLDDSGNLSGTVGGGALEHFAVEKARQILISGNNLLESYFLQEGKLVESGVSLPMACGGKVTLFYEKVGSGESVYIFGGGHVGAAVSRVLEMIGFYTHIIDERKEVLSALETGKQKHLCHFEEFIEKGKIDSNSWILVCTPSHQFDFEVVEAVLTHKIDPKYLGLLASGKKKKVLLERLGSESELNRDLFFCPVGLDTGGVSPNEIAISIAAEMMSVKYRKTGHLHLKDIK